MTFIPVLEDDRHHYIGNCCYSFSTSGGLFRQWIDDTGVVGYWGAFPFHRPFPGPPSCDPPTGDWGLTGPSHCYPDPTQDITVWRYYNYSDCWRWFNWVGGVVIVFSDPIQFDDVGLLSIPLWDDYGYQWYLLLLFDRYSQHLLFILNCWWGHGGIYSMVFDDREHVFILIR